jgi:predicted alpha/beta-hydrolase family hydrolase
MILQRPADAWCIYVLAPGAGGGVEGGFMESFVAALAERGVATLRHELRPSVPKPVLYARVREAVARAALESLPVFAGGKSFGGRMTSEAEAAQPLGVRGIAFVGFPLHPPKQPGTSRAEHLSKVRVPLLFLQGTRDDFAELSLLEPIVESLPKATLHVIEGADHSLRKSIPELAAAFADWARHATSGDSSRRASKSEQSR